MNPPSPSTNDVLLLEFGRDTVEAALRSNRRSFPLKRLPGGRISDDSQAGFVAQLREFVASSGPARSARCTIPSRGAALRRVRVPEGTDADIGRALPLQIEAEFPIPPTELSWLWWHLPAPSNTAPTQERHVLVAALRRNLLQEYVDLLHPLGLPASWTLTLLARAAALSFPQNASAWIDADPTHIDLVDLEHGVITGTRPLSTPPPPPPPSPINPANPSQPPSSDTTRLIDLVRTTATRTATGSLCLSATEPLRSACLRELSPAAASNVVSLPGPSGTDATLQGLNSIPGSHGRQPVPTFATDIAPPASISGPPPFWNWAAAAAALLLVAITVGYADVLVSKPRLARRIREIETYRRNLPAIDRDFSLLQYLDRNRPPYLDALHLLADAIPQGSRLDSVSMTRRGEVSFRGSWRDAQQTADFRAKLIDSGFFADVVVEEQNPTPDRQKVTVRMSAQWKPQGSRPTLVLEAGTNTTANPAKPGRPNPAPPTNAAPRSPSNPPPPPPR